MLAGWAFSSVRCLVTVSAAAMKAKVWVLSKQPVGKPSLEDFKCIEEELPPCQDGDVVIEAVSLSVDPYMRYRIRYTPLNTPIVGSQVAKVIESKNKDFPVNSYVIGYPGWRSHTRVTKQQLADVGEIGPYLPADYVKGFPYSYALGVLGMPGNTAYFGLLEILHPKAGGTVLVNGAAGAVGSLVCQIAKIKGCKVVAFAGSAEKVSWLKSLGIDHVFNYKDGKISEQIEEAAPEGIDWFFDNVGGEFTARALPLMKSNSSVAVCGAISTYNDDPKCIDVPVMTSPFNEGTLIFKEIRVEGFMVTRWKDRWMEGISQLAEWLREGKIKYQETVTTGFENMPKAFLGLFDGENIGKAIVSV